MPGSIRLRLSTMMFLQFCVWGSWYVTLSTYLLAIHFDGVAVGGIYSTVNWGAILAPVIAGMLADRFFPAQIVMGVLHLAGAALLWWISTITAAPVFFWGLLAYAVCFMPTLGLANAVSFHQMSDPATQFPGVRVMGSIGWIAVGLAVGVAAPALLGHSVEATNLPLRFGSVLSLLLGLYCFTLPHTPPGNRGRRPTLFQALGLETLVYLKDRSFAVFTLGSLLICIPLSFYYSFANPFLNEAGMANAAGKMTLGQMSDPATQFPGVRVMGSIGWIAVGLAVGVAAPALLGHSVEATNLPLRFGSVLSLLLGLYCFTLPHTPPGNRDRRPTLFQALGLETLVYLKDRSFAVFTLGSLLICIPLSFYYSFANAFLNETGMQSAAGKMTLGQMSEVLFLVLIPLFFARLGVKKMLLVGMAAWVLRYVLFAFGNNGALVGLLYAGIILHGVCFDFFFVTGQIYVDRVVSRIQRASAQGFIHVVTYGVGQLIGSWAAGWVVDHYAVAQDGATRHLWQAIWTVPAVMAAVVAVLFVVLFKEPETAGRPQIAG